MKLWYLVILLLTASFKVAALPVGNPAEASLHTNGVFYKTKTSCPPGKDDEEERCSNWSYRFGFYGDFVFDRHMQLDTKRTKNHVHGTEVFTQAAYWAINYSTRIDFFGTLGTTKIEMSAPLKTFGGSGNNFYINLLTDTDFSWSIGTRATLWECKYLLLGIEFQYFSARPHIDAVYYTQDNDLFYQPNNVILKYREWQGGVGLAYKVPIICEGTALIPYLAVRFGRATMNSDNLTIVPPVPRTVSPVFSNLESDDDWGYAAGFTLLGCGKLSVTGEVRFLTEKAFYINSQMRF